MSWKNLIFRLTPGALFYRAVTCQKLWRRQVSALVDMGTGDSPTRIVDLGCGAGASSFELAHRLGPTAKITGVDISPVMLHAARNALGSKFSALAGQIDFIEADARFLPFEDESIDLVTGHSFLYLVDEPDAVLREVWRVLTPGGRLLLMEPAQEGNLAATLPHMRTWIRSVMAAPVSAFRFAFAIVHWRMLASVVGSLSKPTANRWLRDAGYNSIEFEPTLAGLGWHVAAQR